MRKQLEQIVKLLPEGLSQTGIEEICSIVEEVINDEVTANQRLLESKVASFLSTKLTDLKEVAREELAQEVNEAKDADAFNKIKNIVATVSDNEEIKSLREDFEEKISKLEESVAKSNELLDNSYNEKADLETQLSESVEIISGLKEQNEELEESFGDMELSDKAHIINENSDGELDGADALDDTFNPHLTEEVIALSDSLNG